jgi:hypothetical protein
MSFIVEKVGSWGCDFDGWNLALAIFHSRPISFGTVMLQGSSQQRVSLCMKLHGNAFSDQHTLLSIRALNQSTLAETRVKQLLISTTPADNDNFPP